MFIETPTTKCQNVQKITDRGTFLCLKPADVVLHLHTPDFTLVCSDCARLLAAEIRESLPPDAAYPRGTPKRRRGEPRLYAAARLIREERSQLMHSVGSSLLGRMSKIADAVRGNRGQPVTPTSFLDIALACIARGWYVFPCQPRSKAPATAHGFKDATLDAALVHTWWTANPAYNVGIACGVSNLCVVDIDHGLQPKPGEPGTLRERIADARERMCLPATSYAVHTGKRSDYGLQIYLEGVDRTGKLCIPGAFGEYTGDLKSGGGYVMGVGSIHPDSGEAYELLDGSPLARKTEAAMAFRVRDAPVKLGDDALIQSDRNSWLTRAAGKMRADGYDAETMRENLHRLNERRMAEPLPPDEVDRIADNASRWALPEEEVQVVVGAQRQDGASNDADPVEGSARPTYPDWVWEGTAYGEFADLCSAGNFVPKKFFSESFRTVVGALVGDRLRCRLTGVTPRAYTIKIAPPGSGKGTSDEYARQFFCVEQWEGLHRTEPALLWGDPNEIHWRSRGIGAQSVSPASAPGLIKAIETRRLKKGEALEPMEAWKPMPRIITMSEEVRAWFANFANESSGAGLESVLCELFDRDSFTSTATKDRGPASGKVMYSLLGGITREGWDSVFSKVESVESGFLSRVSVIGTEQNRTRAGIRPPDFADLQGRFLPMLQRLESEPVLLDADGAALECMDAWFGSLTMPEGITSARLNILAWRTALHLAWLHGHTPITEPDVQGGIVVAEFQARMREYYAPPQGITRAAQCEAAIRRAIRSKRRISVRELRRATHGSRWGIGLWDGALQSLVKAREVRLMPAEKGGPMVVLLRAE